MTPATRMMVAALRGLAEEGLTMSQAAESIGSSYNYVAKFSSFHDIKFVRQVRCDAKCSPGDREERMKSLYSDGKTLAEIGQEFNLTRERVRQILSRHFAMSRADGGKSEMVRRSRREFQRKREARSQRVWGCSYADYRSILGHKDKPTYAYWAQRKNADRRNIPWELSLSQWWKVWEQSGHWNERGRGAGYCMCRLNDTGPYAIDNVYIATGVDNMRDYWVNKRSVLMEPAQ
jgi:hypothetical protein